MARPEVAVITGASAGVGRAAALAFARAGIDVALLARDAEALEAVAREVRALGAQALPIAVDVSDAEGVDAAAAQVEAALGPIDVWVNNAMVTIFAPVSRMTPAEFARVTEVTYLGFVWGTMAALKRMSVRDRGVIVQVGSALAYRSVPLQSAYCGAKHAIRGFTDALRCELMHAKSRIAVTMLQMPALNTPQFDWAACRMPGAPRPLPPVYEPEVAAEAILWSALHPRREMQVGTSSMKAILANKVAPGCLDRYLARTAYGAQQRDELADPLRPANLWQPVPGAHRLRGPFERQAKKRSAALWLDMHRGTVLGASVAIALVALATRGRWRRPT